MENVIRVADIEVTPLHRAAQENNTSAINSLIAEFQATAIGSGMSEIEAAKKTLEYLVKPNNRGINPLRMLQERNKLDDDLDVVNILIKEFNKLAIDAKISEEEVAAKIQTCFSEQFTAERLLTNIVTVFCEEGSAEKRDGCFKSIVFLYGIPGVVKKTPESIAIGLLVDRNLMGEEWDSRLIALLIAYNNKLSNSSNPGGDISESNLREMLRPEESLDGTVSEGELRRLKSALFASVINDECPSNKKAALEYFLNQESSFLNISPSEAGIVRGIVSKRLSGKEMSDEESSFYQAAKENWYSITPTALPSRYPIARSAISVEGGLGCRIM